MPASGRNGSGGRRAAWAGLLLYAGLLALIVLWPVPVDRPAAGLLRGVLGALHRQGLPGWIDYGAVEAAANVLLFLPFGLLVGALLPRRRRWLAVAAAVLLSGTIELAQSGFLHERFGTLQDVLANSLGAALGTAASCLPLRRRSG
ncbi:VanZ family protein, partial [Arthrobacter deserti]|nr:VanZ family protein [Arthrobacter deserti]